ncbi:unnamed protein product [Adineta steineri]|uniref:NHL repeat containing protein-like protein n=1 Tax=Adineta steineri TaxID=433720 RepID=A0A814LKE2_9BILA|nr:unnamed protein product [Adineta steineri]CAF1067426.1 unnamed protein product [Adineta steineri]
MAGTGRMGSRFNELNLPRGIFVDTNFDLYIADCENHRIQLYEFRLGQTTGMPVAGSGTINPTISLLSPNAVVVDAYKYLFILDGGNNRVVGSGPDGFRCLVGCRGGGMESHQLSIPFSFSFDRLGNIFVSDQFNHRIQKFLFLEKSCGKQNAVRYPNGQSRINKWIAENNTFVTVIDVRSTCDSLFIDSNDTLYCGVSGGAEVVKKWLYADDMKLIRVAGTGEWGSNLNQIQTASRIFVDTNFDLYIADCENNRIHLFQLGQSNGTIVAGRESETPTINLYCPSAVLLDAQKYLFIADALNNRIVGSGPDGFRCLVGCRGKGTQPHQFDYPNDLSFDTSGNIFIVDDNNHRVQKFSFLQNSCVYGSLSLKVVFQSSLTKTNQVYFRDCTEPNFHYESIQVNVIENGYYIFRTYSALDTYGYIYEKIFNALDPLENVLKADDQSGSANQFRLDISLQANKTYILVVTTFSPSETGSFDIAISGTNTVTLKKLSEYIILCY